MSEISNKISEVAQGPKSVESGNVKVEAHDVTQLIAADKYLAGKAAASKPQSIIRSFKLIPPGTG